MQQDMRDLKEGIASVSQEIELTPDDESNAIFKGHIKVLISFLSFPFQFKYIYLVDIYLIINEFISDCFVQEFYATAQPQFEMVEQLFKAAHKKYTDLVEYPPLHPPLRPPLRPPLHSPHPLPLSLSSLMMIYVLWRGSNDVYSRGVLHDSSKVSFVNGERCEYEQEGTRGGGEESTKR